MKYTINNLFTLLGNDRKKLPFITFLFLLLSSLELLSLGLIAPYITFLTNPLDFEYSKYGLENFDFLFKSNNVILIISLGMIFIFGIKSFFGILINKKIFQFSFGQELKIRKMLIVSLQNLSYENFMKRNSSEFVHSVQILAGDYSRLLIAILKLTSDILASIAIIYMLFITDKNSLFLLALVLFSSILSYQLLFKNRVANYGKSANITLTELIKFLNESISGFKEIRTLNKESFFRERMVKSAEKYSDVSRKFAVISSAPRFFLEFIIILVFILMVLKMFYYGSNFAESLPIIGVFGVAALRLMPASNQLLSTMMTIQNTKNSIKILSGELNNNPIILAKKNKFIRQGSNISGPLSSIKFLKFKFKYQNTENFILNEMSLEISGGESVGIFGPSGSGKTTLINNLVGLLQPASGEVKINNKIYDNFEDWTSIIGYLPQNVFLIDDSIISNIALGENSAEVDLFRINQAIDKAQLREFINSSSDGLETIIGENGLKISGGQKQRIALARAFYFDKKILILDESTSALDKETGLSVIRELNQLKDRNTVIIVISHDMDTLSLCDRIYRFDNGRLTKY